MMTLVRFALPAAAALFIALGAATSLAGAKDLPRGAAAPRGVTGCEEFGPEFHKAEGTSTCVRIGGSVSVEARWSTGGVGSFLSAPRR